MDIKCVCKDCKNHCECELHDTYEHQENGCNHGQNPIQYCEMKENMEEN